VSNVGMRLALYQGPAEPGSVARNLELLKVKAAQAAGRGARLLICPEMFLSGYNIGPEQASRLAEPAGGPALARAATLARASGIALLLGYPERGADGAIYNAAQLIGRDGRSLANYRKGHLFGNLERGMFRAGDDPPVVVELDGVCVGLMICYDVEFPEAVRLLALAGADLVAVPTALMEPFEAVARTVVPARAIENQVFVAYANRCGHEGNLHYCGLSCVVAPDGADLVRAARGEELVVVDLDLARLRAARTPNAYLRDRRPDLYAPLAHTTATPGNERPRSLDIEGAVDSGHDASISARMAQVIVRNLDEQVVSSLKIKAELHGRSLEQELREILKSAAELTSEEKVALADRIAALTPRPLETDSADLIREDRDSR
jgi:5-aminopentanamidase